MPREGMTEQRKTRFVRLAAEHDAISDWTAIDKAARREKISPELVKSELELLGRALHPNHEFFRKRPADDETRRQAGEVLEALDAASAAGRLDLQRAKQAIGDYLFGRWRGVTPELIDRVAAISKAHGVVETGAVEDLVRDVAGMHEIGEDAAWQEFLGILYKQDPYHAFFRGKKLDGQLVKTVGAALDILKHRGVLDEPKLAKAAKSFMDLGTGQPLRKDVMERLNRLIDWVIDDRNRLKMRYDSLSDFAEKNGVTYDTAKTYMYALAYATMKKPDGEATTKNDVPEEHRELFESISDAIGKGRLDKAKAEDAASVFLRHSPEMDIDRFLKDAPRKDRELKEKARQVASLVERIKDGRMSRWKAHEARAYGRAWTWMGDWMHRKLPHALKQVDRIQGLANALDATGDPKPLEEELKQLGLSAETDAGELLNDIRTKFGIRPGMTQKEIDDLKHEAYSSAIDEAVLWAKAIHEYEQGRLILGEAIRFHHPEAVERWDAKANPKANRTNFPIFSNILKHIWRWNDPHKEWRILPVWYRNRLRRLVKGAPVQARDPYMEDFHKKEMEVAKRLVIGDRIYYRLHNLNKKNPFSLKMPEKREYVVMEENWTPTRA
jgi:hypothetical protein